MSKCVGSTQHIENAPSLFFPWPAAFLSENATLSHQVYLWGPKVAQTRVQQQKSPPAGCGRAHGPCLNTSWAVALQPLGATPHWQRPWAAAQTHPASCLWGLGSQRWAEPRGPTGLRRSLPRSTSPRLLLDRRLFQQGPVVLAEDAAQACVDRLRRVLIGPHAWQCQQRLVSAPWQCRPSRQQG